MDLSRLTRVSQTLWRIEPTGSMRVPGLIFGNETVVSDMDEKVYEQLSNVASLPGIVKAGFAMPDAHWGYGFPIGGVAAFDAHEGGIISAGGVGFDISCGVRCLLSELTLLEIRDNQETLANILFQTIPAGMGRHGRIQLTAPEMDDMLCGGARWAVQQGYGDQNDLAFIESHGCVSGAIPDYVSKRAKDRQRSEMGTLGSGNHYLEIQEVKEIYDLPTAAAFGLRQGQVVVSIHCGSRGLGHQIGTDYLREMTIALEQYGIRLPDRELACAPITSEVGQRYLGAMRAGTNCALANRQIITSLMYEAFATVFPGIKFKLLYDVSHNICGEEDHIVDGTMRKLYVHRKGATRAFGPGHKELPDIYQTVGQPVLIGGTMGTSSYILAGNESSEDLSFSSACHGAGRSMSRHQALKHWHGRAVVDDLAKQGIIIRSPSPRGVAEEAPGAYKDVDRVVQATHDAGLARKVAKLTPIICIKG
jgi:tRNA-splicing ligase RtcB